jgi:hypothetical protein
MSHRPGDVYEFIATDDIMTGGVRAFSKGDPVPASTVEEYGLDDEGLVCHKDQYNAEDGTVDPDAPVVRRGEMPAHLQDSAVVPVLDADPKPTSASAKKAPAKTADKSDKAAD